VSDRPEQGENRVAAAEAACIADGFSDAAAAAYKAALLATLVAQREEAASAERARIAAIMDLPEARENLPVAWAMAKSGAVTLDDARSTLRFLMLDRMGRDPDAGAPPVN
jgi:hypothetical protein